MFEIFLLLALGGATLVLSVYVTLNIFIARDEKIEADKNMSSVQKKASGETSGDKLR
jgi:hypothetical protein